MAPAIKLSFKNILTGILILGAFCILIYLSLWQLNRLSWKENIITQLEEIYTQDVHDNLYRFDDLNTEQSNQDIPIRYGSLRGKFDYTKEILVGPKTYNKQISYQVITPLRLNTGGHVLISRGYITVDNKDKIKDTHVSSVITVSGLIRQPDWTKFTPQNSPENDVWSRLDINQIAQAKGIDKIAPVILYAESISREIPLITLQKERWMPRNKHAQYAVFWFTMALVMLGVFGFYARTQFIVSKK